MQQLMAKQTSKFDACINPKAILTIQSSSFKQPETLNIKLLTSKECRLLTSMCSFKNKLRSLFFFNFILLYLMFMSFIVFVHIGSQCLVYIFLLLCIHSILLNVPEGYSVPLSVLHFQGSVAQN